MSPTVMGFFLSMLPFLYFFAKPLVGMLADYFSVSCFNTYNLPTTLSGARGFIASGSIQSTSVITSGSDVRLQAGGSILFSPGFTATAGSVLKARIKDCNYTE